MRPAMHGDVLEGRSPEAASERVSAELDGWLRAEPHPTLGGLVAVSGHKSFAIAFVLLLGVPALPRVPALTASDRRRCSRLRY